MLKNDRMSFIMNFLKKNKTAKVGDLSEKLAVTSETIRRDLEYLEEKGKIKRVHGGAMIQQTNIPETNFLYRESINIEEKKHIAEHACQFIKEDDFIALDVSTTNTEIAKQLVNRFEKLTVLTNSLVIATILSQTADFKVLLPGGRLRNSELCIVGGPAISYIHQFHIDTFFMSVSGVSLEEGLTDNGHNEFEVKMAMFANAVKTFAVADHTKFESTSMLRIGDISKVNGIITDPLILPTLAQKYTNNGVQLFYKQADEAASHSANK